MLLRLAPGPKMREKGMFGDLPVNVCLPSALRMPGNFSGNSWEKIKFLDYFGHWIEFWVLFFFLGGVKHRKFKINGQNLGFKQLFLHKFLPKQKNLVLSFLRICSP